MKRANPVYVWPTIDRNDIIHSDRVSDCSIGLQFSKCFFFFFFLLFDLMKNSSLKLTNTCIGYGQPVEFRMRNGRQPHKISTPFTIHNIQEWHKWKCQNLSWYLRLAHFNRFDFFLFASFVTSDSVFFFSSPNPKETNFLSIKRVSNLKCIQSFFSMCIEYTQVLFRVVVAVRLNEISKWRKSPNRTEARNTQWNTAQKRQSNDTLKNVYENGMNRTVCRLNGYGLWVVIVVLVVVASKPFSSHSVRLNREYFSLHKSVIWHFYAYHYISRPNKTNTYTSNRPNITQCHCV